MFPKVKVVTMVLLTLMVELGVMAEVVMEVMAEGVMEVLTDGRGFDK